MVRSEGWLIFEDFKKSLVLAVGWVKLFDLSKLKALDDFKSFVAKTYPDY